MASFYVYALKSTSFNWIYVGMTTDLQRRVDEHNRGKNKSTKPYCPFELFYSEILSSSIEARAREKFLKSGSGKRWLKKLLESCAGLSTA